MDSLEIVEMVMVFEEIFGTEIPDDDAELLGSPREMVDLLERQLSNQPPNKQAATFLRKLAKDQQRPDLVEGLEGTWRREQIAAIVREMLK
jgi:hypothetical protein